MGVKTNYSLASEVFKQLAMTKAEFNGMSYDKLGLKGASAAVATTGATA